jgi:uncharacterized protein (DUF1330 family)
MKVANAENPTGDQIKAAIARATGKPICMVNLLKFKDKAVYADGRPCDLTGREAYALYGKAVRELIEGFGGKFIFAGQVRGLLIGEVEELWDQVAIMQYPDMQAMADMMRSPDYLAIHVHREAGLAGQLLIETAGMSL